MTAFSREPNVKKNATPKKLNLPQRALIALRQAVAAARSLGQSRGLSLREVTSKTETRLRKSAGTR